MSLLVLSLFWTVGTALPTEAADRGPRAVILLLANVGVSDVDGCDLPAYEQLAEISAVGLMNNRTAGSARAELEMAINSVGMEAACATLCAGTRARAGAESRRAYNVGEKISGLTAASRYQLLTWGDSGKAEIVHLGMATLSSLNRETKYNVHIGGLGDALRQKGMVSAALGNSDTRSNIHREAVTICSDSSGLVGLGDVGGRMKRADPTGPYGLSTDTESLLRQFDKVLETANLIVVDAGDTARADSYALECTEEQAARLRRWAVKRSDLLLAGIVSKLDFSRDLLLVVSPNAPREGHAKREVLTPIIAVGPKIDKGLLTSASTRRSGLITISDVTATLVEHLDLEVWSGMVGRPIYSVTALDTLKAMQDLSVNLSSQARGLIVMRYIAWGFVLLVLVTTVSAVAVRDDITRRRAAILGVLPAALFPAVLWLPSIHKLGVAGALASVIVLTIAVAAIAITAARTPHRAFLWLSSAFTLTVAIDLLRGGVLLRDSVLSFAASEGARYYGIGNELMGAFIGAASITIACGLAKRLPKRGLFLAVAGLFCCGIVAVVGSPKLGANAGGAMAAGCGCLVMFLVLLGRRVRLPEVLAAGGGAVLVAAVLLFADSIRGAGQSHIGRAAHVFAGGDWLEFWSIVERKLMMNVMLFSSSVWSRSLIVSCCACLALLLCYTAGTRCGLRSDGGMRAAAAGITAGTVAALLLNDSGVVAAATCVLYLWGLFLTALTKKAEDATSSA